jgi:hypothetical protein
MLSDAWVTVIIYKHRHSQIEWVLSNLIPQPSECDQKVGDRFVIGVIHLSLITLMQVVCDHMQKIVVNVGQVQSVAMLMKLGKPECLLPCLIADVMWWWMSEYRVGVNVLHKQLRPPTRAGSPVWRLGEQPAPHHRKQQLVTKFCTGPRVEFF